MIHFFSCTKKAKYQDTLLYKSLIAGDADWALQCTTSNSKSISSVYNDFIDNEISELKYNDIVVFTHDDVYINCGDLENRLKKALTEYDVIGVAGSVSANIKEPALWHLMSPREDHRGAAAHSINKESYTPYFITSFGILPSRVLLIDGVFIATTKRVLEKVRFDETNPARFHYYDLDFSLQCNKAKYKIGVWDVPIVHMSPGLTNPDDEWRQGQNWFINKWSDNN